MTAQRRFDYGFAFGLIALCILGIAAVIFCPGCADKVGSTIDGYDLHAADPSNVDSRSVLGYNGPTLLAGKGAVQSSQMDDGGINETNNGAQAVQRILARIPVNVKTPEGSTESRWLQLAMSSPTNGAIEDLNVTTRADGTLDTFHVKGLTTDNATVQKAVNERVAVEVQAYIAGSQADRDVQLKKLETQAKLGDTAAQLALNVITALKPLMGVP